MERLTLKYLRIAVYSSFPISVGIGIGLGTLPKHVSRNMFFVRDELLLPGTILVSKLPFVETPSQFYEILNAMFFDNHMSRAPFHDYSGLYQPFLRDTPLKTNITSPENQWLEDGFPTDFAP